MGEGALYTAGATWAVDLAPVRRQGLALGLFGLAVWGGLSLGPLMGELLRSAAGYNAVWALTAVLPFVAALIAMCLPEPVRGGAGTRDGAMGCSRARRAARGWRSRGQRRLRGARRVHGARPALLRRGRRGERVHRVRGSAVFVEQGRLQPASRSPGPAVTATGAALFETLGARDHRPRPVARGGARWRARGGRRLRDVFPALALMVVGEVGEERRGSALGAFTAFFDIGVGLGARGGRHGRAGRLPGGVPDRRGGGSGRRRPRGLLGPGPLGGPAGRRRSERR